MKQLLTLLLILNVSSIFAQNHIREYQINAPGSHKGLVIESGFRISVEEINIEVDSLAYISMGITTYKDSTHNVMLSNDSILTGYTYLINIPQCDILTLPEMIDSLFKPRLIQVYGESNVVEK